MSISVLTFLRHGSAFLCSCFAIRFDVMTAINTFCSCFVLCKAFHQCGRKNLLDENVDTFAN
jgi:hypothetical protein